MDPIQTVAVTINVPKAEKDLVDAMVLAYKDVKANKGAAIIADELPLIMKLAGEFGELMSELKSKQSINALAYLASEVEGIL